MDKTPLTPKPIPVKDSTSLKNMYQHLQCISCTMDGWIDGWMDG
jgi:hypothetical protein